jgi:hypothetical protein
VFKLPISSDFEDILTVFVYTNLPVLMNPANAMNVVVVSDTTTPTATITSITPNVPVTTTAPTIVIAPELITALQAGVINNFTDLGLPPDIQEITQQFFALLPTTVTTVTTTM